MWQSNDNTAEKGMLFMTVSQVDMRLRQYAGPYEHAVARQRTPKPVPWQLIRHLHHVSTGH